MFHELMKTIVELPTKLGFASVAKSAYNSFILQNKGSKKILNSKKN